MESGDGRRRLLRWWGALLIATIVLCLAVATRYFVAADLDRSPSTVLFRVVMLVAHFATLCTILLSPVLLLAACWPRRPVVIASGIAVASLILIGMLIDTQVYQLYHFHINAGVLSLLFGGAARATFIFPWLMYAEATAIALAAIALVTGTSLILWRAVKQQFPHTRLAGTLAAVAIACLVLFHGTHIWADAVGYEPILEQTAVLPLRYAATAKRFLRARGIRVHTNHLAEHHAFRESSALSYPLRPLECSAPSRSPNIVFIVVDSWRFDAMNERITPHVAAFSREATRFVDHHSGGNATRIGVFSLFYGIPGTYWHRMLSEQRSPVLLEELQRRRYDIRPFRSTPLYSPEFDRTVFANVKLDRLTSDGDGPVAWDRDLTNDFLAYLEARDASRPFFAFLFYDAPHNFQLPNDAELVFQPSLKHVNYLRLNRDTDPTLLLNRYRNSVHYVDSLIGRALDGLRRRDLLANTIVVITGDHGQEFNDTGLNNWGHGSNFSRYQTSVPLILYVPGRQPGIVRHRTSHFDVAPTLLRDELGCSSSAELFSVGTSLFDPKPRDPIVLSEYSDFALLQRDRVAVVRKHGMQILGPDYNELDSALDPAITRAALEQKTRFLVSTHRSVSDGDDHPRSLSAAE